MVRREELDKAEHEIRELMGVEEIDPLELIQALRDKQLPDFAIREAIWRMIDMGELDLTTKRTLRYKVPA